MMDKGKLADELYDIGEKLSVLIDRLGVVDDVVDDGRLDCRDPPGAYSHLERAKYLIHIVESELEDE